MRRRSDPAPGCCRPTCERTGLVHGIITITSRNVRVVDGVRAAIAHITGYGSAHLDSIVTRDEMRPRAVSGRVDSASGLLECLPPDSPTAANSAWARKSASVNRQDRARADVGLEEQDQLQVARAWAGGKWLTGALVSGPALSQIAVMQAVWPSERFRERGGFHRAAEASHSGMNRPRRLRFMRWRARRSPTTRFPRTFLCSSPASRKSAGPCRVFTQRYSSEFSVPHRRQNTLLPDLCGSLCESA